MSGNIDWMKVAKTIVQTLGVETARGLYYALLAQLIYPQLTEAVNKLIKGETLTPQEKTALSKKLTEIIQQAPTSYKTIIRRELEQELAKLLAKYSQIRFSVKPYISAEIKLIEKDIKTLEQLKSILLNKLSKAKGEEKNKLLKQLEKIENELQNKTLKLERLKKLKSTESFCNNV